MEHSRARLGVALVLVVLLTSALPSLATGAQGTTPAAGLAVDAPVEFILEIGAEHFKQPADVTVGPDGSVWVVDRIANQILTFAPSGELLDTFGASGMSPGRFNFGFYGAVDLDAEGTIYVLDHNNNRVQKFAPDRTFLTEWGSYGTGEGQFIGAADLAVDSAGNISVADPDRGDIQIFSADGTFLRAITSPCPDGQFQELTRLGVDAMDNLYVGDTTQVHKFAPDGTHLLTFGSEGIDDGQFGAVVDVAVGADGTIYVSDGIQNRVQAFDPAGTFVSQWGRFGTGPGEFDEADALALDGAGHLYVLDFSNTRVQKFRLLPPLAPEGAGTPTP